MRGILCLFSGMFFCFGLCLPGNAVPLTEDAEIDGHYLSVDIPAHGGILSHLVLKASPGDIAGDTGLTEEGFGIANPYVPCRRLNEKTEMVDTIKDRPVIRYEYDCEGSNIDGLHVIKTIEPYPNQASIRVTWRVENRGQERHWVAPWVRNPVHPGGSFGKEDQVDIPTMQGIRSVTYSGYFPAARNWASVTDTVAAVTVYGVFNADMLHSFLGVREEEDKQCGFQAAYVPRLMEPGDVWETVYRLNVVRGLKHVNFASDELAAQVDYQAGKLNVVLTGVTPMKGLRLQASIRADKEHVWKLPVKMFDIDPNRTVLCSYDWTAPSDGVFEFMGQVLRNETEVMKLGTDTASPHGGIDTQFVVGKVRRTSMEPWTDAPYALERGKRTLKRSLAHSGETAIWFENALEKIFRDDAVTSEGNVDSTVRIQLARNERESFQVVLRPPEGTDLTHVVFQPKALVGETTGKSIGPENLRIFNELYCPVRIPTHFEGATGEWPDALPATKPFTAKGGQCTPVWFTLYVPPGTPAGKYTGSLILTASGNVTIPLTIEATVFDFDIPVTPSLKTDFGFAPEMALNGCTLFGSSLSAQALNEQYSNDALEHRVTLREMAAFPVPSSNYAKALAEAEKRIKRLALGGATTFAVPPELLGYPEELSMVVSSIKKLGIGNRVFCPISEEPPPPAWPALAGRMKDWTEAAPDIPLMVTALGLQPFLPGAAKIWTVHTQLLDTANNKPILEQVKTGSDVWCYINNYPPRPYANWFVDFPGVEHRILFWQAWALGLRGMHYWGINYCEPGRNPYEGLSDVTPVNGDGFLVYPGPNGPVGSIRWEIVRDGIEDFDYLSLLMERFRKVQASGKDGALLEKVAGAMDLKPLVPDLVTFSRDSSVLMQKRIAIANAIVELGKSLK